MGLPHVLWLLVQTCVPAAVPLSQQGDRGTWEIVLCPWEPPCSQTDFTRVFGHCSENAFREHMRWDCPTDHSGS